MITARDITATVRDLGVLASDTVFVHSDVGLCHRVAGTTTRQKLDVIAQGLADAVSDGVLMMPSFSYSFCRREVFDIARSPSTVGGLTEHFRLQPGVRRTADPIFSTAVLGALPRAWEQDLFAIGDKDCFGPRSIFAYLLEAEAKLLCFGKTACTFIHHTEQRARISYRYFKDFRGIVSDGSALTFATARYFVRPLEARYDVSLALLFEALRASGELSERRLPRGPGLSVAPVPAIDRLVLEGTRADPWFLLEGPRQEQMPLSGG